MKVMEVNLNLTTNLKNHSKLLNFPKYKNNKTWNSYKKKYLYYPNQVSKLKYNYLKFQKTLFKKKN